MDIFTPQAETPEDLIRTVRNDFGTKQTIQLLSLKNSSAKQQLSKMMSFDEDEHVTNVFDRLRAIGDQYIVGIERGSAEEKTKLEQSRNDIRDFCANTLQCKMLPREEIENINNDIADILGMMTRILDRLKKYDIVLKVLVLFLLAK